MPEATRLRKQHALQRAKITRHTEGLVPALHETAAGPLFNSVLQGCTAGLHTLIQRSALLSLLRKWHIDALASASTAWVHHETGHNGE